MMSYKKSVHEPTIIVGYTTRKHLILDLDNTSLRDAILLTYMLLHEYPEVGDALITLSSVQEGERTTRINRKGIPRHGYRTASFHLITNNVIGYERCMHIINVLVDLNLLQPAYRRVRMFRGDMTLRVSPSLLSDRIKEQPMPLIYIFNVKNKQRDYKIRDYLGFWESVGRLFLAYDDTKAKTYYRSYCTYYTTEEDPIEAYNQSINPICRKTY